MGKLGDEDIQFTPVLESIEETREKLEKWLAQELDVDLRIPDLDVPESNGMSNVTMIFDAEFPADDEREAESYVARIQPQGDCLAFPEYDLGLQTRLMQLVAEYSDVPVPSVVGEDLSGNVLGQPFYIMKKTDGFIPPDVPPYHMDGWFTQETTDTRALLWNEGIRAMGDVNNIDSVGFQKALKGLNFSNSLEQQLEYWEKYYQWGFQSESGFLKHDVVEQVLPWLRENMPQEQVTRLCWGDSRMANVIFNGEKNGVAALLDWEMASLGDPLQDLAWWIYMDELFTHGLGLDQLSEFPSREQSIAVWCDKTGLSADNLHYYLVFAGLRFALILGRMSIGKGNQESIDSHFNSGFEVQYLLKIFNSAI